MHSDEVDVDTTLVRRLLAAQFPYWATQPLWPVPSAGTDNLLFRLGDSMAVRLPRVGWAAGQVEKDRRWLPRLAPHLPLAVPVPLTIGEPAAGYPFTWGIYEWLDGAAATVDTLSDPVAAAHDMARFLHALRSIEPDGAPLCRRGRPLAVQDEDARAAIAALAGELDAAAATAAWDESLAAAPWTGAPTWLHGDLLPGNLLVTDGTLSAVIDFAVAGVGDPACDLMVAWSLFTGESRKAFRAAMDVDDDTWARGRGWALSVALIQLPYYRDTNPALVAQAWRTVGEVLS